MAEDIIPSLDPLRARVINALCLCELPWSFKVGARDCRLAVGANMEDAPFSCACSVPIQVGDGLWRLEMGSLAPLRLLPELEQAWPEEGFASTLASLPEGLRLAVFESLLGPLLDKLAQWLLCTVHVVDVPLDVLNAQDSREAQKSSRGDWMALQWKMALPAPTSSPSLAGGEGESADNAYELGNNADALLSDSFSEQATDRNQISVPIRLYWPNASAARHVAGRLESLPRRRVVRPDIPVTCAVEVGRLTLPLNELRDLELGDVLLPNPWHPEQPHIYLPGGTGLVCRVTEGLAVVVGVLPALEASLADNSGEPANGKAVHQENTMAQKIDNLESANVEAQPLHVDVDKLEVSVRFELESMTLSVGDLAALSTGYTFALACDPTSPVTLRVGGVAVAQGRMVDLNGVPGVQVTRMLAGADNPS